MNERIEKILNSKRVKCKVSRPNGNIKRMDLLFMDSIQGEPCAIAGDYSESIGGYPELAEIGLLPECEIEILRAKGYIVESL
jgi:hypothetical protein